MSEFYDSPEFRNKRSAILDRTLRYFGVYENLRTPEDRYNYFVSLGAEGFINELTTLNSILGKNNKNIAEGKPGKRTTAGIINDNGKIDILAAPEYTDQLLSYLYDSIKDATEIENLDYIAGAMAFGVNLIHPFNNFNGRTSRTLFTLLSPKYDTSIDSLRHGQLPAEDGGIYADPSFGNNVFYPILQDELHTHKKIAGRNQPYILPATTTTSMWDIEPKRRPFSSDDAAALHSIFMHEFISGMVPAILKTSSHSRAARESFEVIGNQEFFFIDRYAENASAKDLEELYGVVAQIKNAYIISFIDEMTEKYGAHHSFQLSTKEEGDVWLKLSEIVTYLPAGTLSLSSSNSH